MPQNYTHRTSTAADGDQPLRLMGISQPTDTQSFESQIPSEEEELGLELAEALGWKNAATEACLMLLAGGSLLGSSTAM